MSEKPDKLRAFLEVVPDDLPEADWLSHANALMDRGLLARIEGSEPVFVDLPALAQPYGCDSARCTPGKRKKDDRSCCADLWVAPEEDEVARITEHLPRIAAFLAPHDERWSEGAPTWLEDEQLTHPGRRCVFAFDQGQGLRCGIESAGVEKPAACQLFPLALIDIDDGGVLLSAVHRDTAANLGTYPAKRFPCLGVGAQTLARAEEATLRRFFEGPVVDAILAVVDRHARG